MKRIIKLTEFDLNRIVKRIITERDEFEDENNSDEPKYLSQKQWEDIWLDLRRVTKSFHFPDYGMFVFGGLFFYYNEADGTLILEPQKLTDWRNEPEDAAEVLDSYIERIGNFLRDYDPNLKLHANPDYSMKIYFE